jgi:hypothetical protein
VSIEIFEIYWFEFEEEQFYIYVCEFGVIFTFQGKKRKTKQVAQHYGFGSPNQLIPSIGNH